MSRLSNLGLVLVIGAALLPRPAAAYNILSVNMGGYWNSPYDQYWGGVDGYGAPGAAGERWYTRVDYQDLNNVDLSQFDVLYVQSAFTDNNVTIPTTGALAALQSKATEIQEFVAGGGGLVALSEPLAGVGSWDWAPVELSSIGVYHDQSVEVVDAAHPVMANSTSASLSNWDTSWHGYFDNWDDRLDVLARTGDYGPSDPRTHQALTLAGTYGDGCCGRMVFTMQDPDFHSYQGFEGARTLIGDALDWAACSQPVPEPSTWALLAGGLGAMAALRRRRAAD